jgi:hypothetical protein
MGVSLEVVGEWIKRITEQKQLDKVDVMVGRQRKALQDKADAKAAKRGKR